MATSCPPRVLQRGAELVSPEPLTHWGHSWPCPQQASPGRGIQGHPQPGQGWVLPSLLIPTGLCVPAGAGPVPASQRGMVAAPGCCDVGSAPKRSCWLLPKAAGRLTGPLLPPAAAAPRPALTAEPARLLGHGEMGESSPAPGYCQSEAQPSRTALASPSPGKGAQGWALPGGPHRAPLAPPCAGGTHHSPLTVQPHTGAQAGLLPLLRGLSGSSLCQGARQEGRQTLCPITAVPAVLAGIYFQVAKETSSGVASALKNYLTPA